MFGIVLAAAIAAQPVVMPDTMWKVQLFVDTVHKINYGEVIATNCESKLTVDDRTYRILDHDGKYREFVIDAFKTDLAKEFPTITTNHCGRGHENCPCVRMYLARHEVYVKQDRMRLQWIEDTNKQERRRSYITSRLFYRRPKPIRWVPPKQEESSTGK